MAGESRQYFEKEADSVLPDYSINRVIVGEKNIRLLCSLNRDEDINYDSWLGSSDLFKYINFYFILTSGLTPSSLSKVYYPKARVQSLKYGSGDAGMINWEQTFALKEQPGGRKSRTNGSINYIYGYIKANMDEIVRGNYFIKDKDASQSKNAVPLNIESIIDGTGFGAPEGDDTFFEVDLACDPGWLDIDQTSQRDHYRNIISFAQLDIKQLSEEFNLNNFIGKLSEFGGPMHYEKLLELSPFVGEVGKSIEERVWFVPKTINYFEDQQGNPFSGTTHYHGEENPGPNGYIGWMSGPPGDGVIPMDQRTRLTKREIPNTKVISKLFIERALGFDGKPLSDKNRFSGYPNALDVSGDSLASPHGSLSFGENMLQNLRSEIGMATLQTPEEGQNTLQTPFGYKMRNLAIKKEQSDSLNFSFFMSSWIDTEEQNYSTLFSLMKERLLKYSSPLGYFLDFHRDAIPADIRVESQIGRAQYDPVARSLRFIKRCTSLSKIYTLKVTRKRVSNLPSANNSLGMPKYEDYKEERAEELLINFSDSNELPPGADTEVKAALDSVYEDYYTTSGISSLFILKDFDLFRNVTQGNYKYSIEVVFVDGVKENLRSLYKSFSRAIQRFSKYLEDASRPFIKGNFSGEDPNSKSSYIPTPEEEQEGILHNRGSYDYEREQFSKFFIDSKTEKYRRVVERVVGLYVTTVYLLTKRTSFFSGYSYEKLVNMLLPDKADLGNIKMFLELCQNLEETLKSKIVFKESNVSETMNLGTHKRRVGSSLNFPNNLITVKADIQGVAKVASKNSVFYSVSQNQDTEEQDVSQFFTLQTELEDSTFAEQQLLTDRNDTPNIFNSNGEAVNQAAGYFRSEIGDPNNNFSDIVAGLNIEFPTQQGADRVTSFPTDVLTSENAVVHNFGGTTFNYLLSKTMSLAPETVNECGEVVQSDADLRTVEESIFSTLIQSDNRQLFLEEVEENYREYYFKKEALGNLYDFIKDTMSNKYLLSKMNNIRTEQKLKKYRRRANTGTRSEREISERKRKRREMIKPESKPMTDLYVMKTDGTFVLASEEPFDATPILERREKSKSITSEKSPVLTDNVYIGDDPAATQGIAASRAMAPRANTSIRGVPTGRPTGTVGGSRGGGTSGGY